jgi:hypothetical protein
VGKDLVGPWSKGSFCTYLELERSTVQLLNFLFFAIEEEIQRERERVQSAVQSVKSYMFTIPIFSISSLPQILNMGKKKKTKYSADPKVLLS